MEGSCWTVNAWGPERADGLCGECKAGPGWRQGPRPNLIRVSALRPRSAAIIGYVETGEASGYTRLSDFERKGIMSARITVKSNGSLRVEGEFELLDADGTPFDLGGRTAISLCRCGHSGDKPFCDSSHKRVGFQECSKARALPPKT